jgi:hypothetical protein
MNDVYVFVGPSLDVQQAHAKLPAVYLPPVSEGDIYRLSHRSPRAIGIIDGYFERVPAVWHKEIMWVMAQGVHVFGSASMGALRAAELERFGMRGSGWIFEAFRDGLLNQDDEVAVAHSSSEDGYRSLSVAMVNIRRSLYAALQESVISQRTHDALIAAAKSTFYQDRLWPIVIQAARPYADSEELDALHEWLLTHAIDQKANDARNMLREMNLFLSQDPPPLHVSWNMANTVVWNTARRRAGTVPFSSEDATGTLLEGTLNEIRLLGQPNFEDARNRSLLRLFAVANAERDGMAPDGESVNRFRLRRGLDSGSQLEEFIADNEMQLSDVDRVAAVEDMTRWAAARAQHEAFEGLFDDLRLRGEYERFVGRARLKHEELSRRGLLNAKPQDVGCSEEAVLDWYFVTKLGIAVPENLVAYARESGFPDELTFRRAVWGEYFFTSATATSGLESELHHCEEATS